MIVPERKLVGGHVYCPVGNVYACSQQRTRRHISIRGSRPTVICIALVEHHLAEAAYAICPYAQFHCHIVAASCRFARFKRCRKELPPKGLVGCCKGHIPECLGITFLRKAHIHVVVKTTVSTRPHARRVVG